jgi:hypothetical protein
MSDSDTRAALKRAGGRAAYHLARAALEWLKAVEAVVEELSAARRDEDTRDGETDRGRIDIEIE